MFLLFILLSQKCLILEKKIFCVFIGYEKYFDKIDRSDLRQKLLAENISCKLVQAINAMYFTVQLYVIYRHSFENHFFFSSQMSYRPQTGDPSSPLLFILFVNDILDNINSNLNDIFTIDEHVSHSVCR